VTFSNFTDYLGDLDWLALIVAGVAVFAFAWLWYGPVFGKQWRAETGREMSTPDPMTMGKGFVKFFLFGVGLAFFYPAVHVAFQNASSFETLIVTSFVMAFFVIGMALASRVVWEGSSWKLWAIDFGFWFLAAIISSYISLDLMA
jgi:hypothetical protein